MLSQAATPPNRNPNHTHNPDPNPNPKEWHTSPSTWEPAYVLKCAWLLAAPNYGPLFVLAYWEGDFKASYRAVGQGVGTKHRMDIGQGMGLGPGLGAGAASRVRFILCP